MTILIVARHGNTFEPGETPRRVGVHTDLPLTAAGHEHGRNLGLYLKKINLLPDVVFTSHLKRTAQTAQDMIQAAGLTLRPRALGIFNELDYGPDENKTEDLVLARLGQQALNDWEDHAIMPPGWSPNSKTITTHWQNFSKQILSDHPGKVVMVVTSNGIARFALNLADDFETQRNSFSMKLATGAFGLLDHDGERWSIQNWNTRP